MIFESGYFSNNLVSDSFITETLNEARNFSNRGYTSKPTVFLSHKHKDLADAKDAKGFMKILQDYGAKVYIDSMDNNMPGHTCGETALRIKDEIKTCKKFILLATEKAIESYWCNWELGIGDTHKYIDHIAILPIKQKGQFDFQYKGNEYLQIYPSIDYEDGTNRYRSGDIIPAGYYVCKPRNDKGIQYITKLDKWLQQ